MIRPVKDKRKKVHKAIKLHSGGDYISWIDWYADCDRASMDNLAYNWKKVTCKQCLKRK